jgi:hypothetical protein
MLRGMRGADYAAEPSTLTGISAAASTADA